MEIKDRHILLGVTGGIAAYKAAELTRLLVKAGAKVQAVMTKNATQFITPLTLKTLTGQPVLADTFEEGEADRIPHIDIASKADLFLIAPATANTIGKFAGGIADDLLSTLYLVATSPVVIAPAMNQNMYMHAAVKKNISVLKTRGVFFSGPASGDLACGESGPGKMEDPSKILTFIKSLPSRKKDMSGAKVVITAGPTHEYIDAVRYIANASSGKMGYALAEEVFSRGGEVTLISGPVGLPVPPGVKCLFVTSAKEMKKSVFEETRDANVLIMAAAVGDFSSEIVHSGKQKKEDVSVVKLKKNPDILLELSKREGEIVRVGFAAETERLLENSKSKLHGKKLDMIIANDVSRPDIGFGSDMNQVTVIEKNGEISHSERETKRKIASFIVGKILPHIENITLNARRQ
ncbi:MAG: bifunctional phosphopantothenoylcysteine decarboxylase/phosphopantothenate--cysteine ligase CoaBC [Nitrospinota bacterium]